MKEFFTFKEMSENKWMICPNHNEFSDSTLSGSYALLACRISGLPWPQWLRYCRQNGATLYGKNSQYICAVWKTPNKDFLNKLNSRANEIDKIFKLKELKL